MEINNNDVKPRIIAFYLPQFHPIPENDKWWGKGFTEWTNVAKMKPMYRGHYQPKLPADLGFYDLRLPETRIAQAQLAKEAGIEGFCYWHYWFGGKDRQLLENPFLEVLNSGKPNFPFCLGWANESWEAKIWNADKVSATKNILIEQLYLGEKDNLEHFNCYEKAFRDNRYIRVDDRPFFLIYKPFKFYKIREFIKQWNLLIKETGIADSFYFVAECDNEDKIDELIEMGFDAVSLNMNTRMLRKYKQLPKIVRGLKKITRRLFNIPLRIKYNNYKKYQWIDEVDSKEYAIPTLLPNWDHTCRSHNGGVVLEGATPKRFEDECNMILRKVVKKKNNLVLLKSWNEWGEGNYMEPDQVNGKGYIKSLARAIDNLNRD